MEADKSSITRMATTRLALVLSTHDVLLLQLLLCFCCLAVVGVNPETLNIQC